MSNHKCCGCDCENKHKKAHADITSPNYQHEVNSKAHNKSPYGKEEPSTHTTYK